jgi:hypothetical protein
MRRSRVTPAKLYALACLAVLTLLLLSDFGPVPASGLDELGTEPGELRLVVLGCRACNNGHLINVSDGQGARAEAFLPAEIWPSEVASGTQVRATLVRSSTDPDFLIVQGMEVLNANGKD